MSNEKLQEQMEIEEAKKVALQEIYQEELEEYKKEHTMICPSCGGVATNQAPNGAGILEESNWWCPCGWEEGKYNKTFPKQN